MIWAAGFANFDRFVVGPMLVALALTFQASISSVSHAATAYFVAYGVSQPIWGVISDRYGRVKVVRIALVIGAAGSVLSALSPSVLALSSARALAGAAFGAIVPAAITYIGDTVVAKKRQSALSDMIAVMAVGSTLATALAGLVADYASWRIMFGAIALASLGLLLRLSNVQEPHAIVARNVVHPLKRIQMVLRSKWAVLVMVLSLAEGALTLGIFALLPAAIEQQGASTASAGLLAGIYGVSMLVATRMVKRLAANPLVPLAVGGLALTVGHTAAALVGGVAPLVATVVLLGIAWAGFHSSLQAWGTLAVPQARATCIALMTSALFLGSGLGTALGGQLLDSGRVATLFGIAGITSALISAVAIAARKAYVPPVEAHG